MVLGFFVCVLCGGINNIVAIKLDVGEYAKAEESALSLDLKMERIKAIQQENGMALWLISHDLALVSNMADRVAVSRCIRDTDLF
jgi:ABC-type microcin C transport system duplicated ATPase subunit YejF